MGNKLTLKLTFLFIFGISSYALHAQEVRTNDRGEKIVIFPDGSWRYFMDSDSVYLKKEVQNETPQVEETPPKPSESEELAKSIMIAERALGAEKSAKFVLQNAVRRQESIEQSISQAKADPSTSLLKMKELENQLKQVKEEIKVAKKELKNATIKRRMADKLLLAETAQERAKIIASIEKTTYRPPNARTKKERNTKIKKEKNTKPNKEGIVKTPRVKKEKIRKSKEASSKKDTSEVAKNNKDIQQRIKKSKKEQADRSNPAKVAKANSTGIKKEKRPKKPKVRKAKTTGEVDPNEISDELADLKKVKTKKPKTPRVKKEKAPKQINNANAGVKTRRLSKKESNLPKGKSIPSYEASLKWDKRDVINDPPNGECNVKSTIIDEFSKKRTVIMESDVLFTYTPDEIKNYLEDRDYIKCEANLSTKPGVDYLTLKFTISSDNARKSFGVLEQGSLLRIMFLDGSTLNLYNGRFDAGKLDPYSGNTIYETNYLIDKEKRRLLSRKEIDKIRVVWSVGYEDYVIYNVDFFITQFDCLSKQ
ncbi:MAG: hypothetical protein AAGK97_01445 [Bacteroidota bacterium]